MDYADRNLEIYVLCKRGSSFGKIAEQYGITRNRVAQIYAVIESDIRRVKRVLDMPDELELFIMGSNEKIARRVYNRLRRAGINTIAEFQTMDLEFVRRNGGIGEGSIDFIRRMQAKAREMYQNT